MTRGDPNRTIAETGFSLLPSTRLTSEVFPLVKGVVLSDGPLAVLVLSLASSRARVSRRLVSTKHLLQPTMAVRDGENVGKADPDRLV